MGGRPGSRPEEDDRRRSAGGDEGPEDQSVGDGPADEDEPPSGLPTTGSGGAERYARYARSRVGGARPGTRSAIRSTATAEGTSPADDPWQGDKSGMMGALTFVGSG